MKLAYQKSNDYFNWSREGGDYSQEGNEKTRERCGGRRSVLKCAGEWPRWRVLLSPESLV